MWSLIQKILIRALSAGVRLWHCDSRVQADNEDLKLNFGRQFSPCLLCPVIRGIIRWQCGVLDTILAHGDKPDLVLSLTTHE